MSLLHPLPPEASNIEAPQQFTFPFCYEAHPLCLIAAKEVTQVDKRNMEKAPTQRVIVEK